MPRRTTSRNRALPVLSRLFKLQRNKHHLMETDHENFHGPAESGAGPKRTSECAPGEYWRWCPRCGHELHNEKCKLRCPRCHYFLSCSDFD